MFGVGGGGTGQTTYTYSADIIWGICEGAIGSVTKVWLAQTETNTASMNMTVFTDTLFSQPWSFLTSHFPDAAYPYNNIAYVGAAPADLGDNAQIPNVNFEVSGAFDGTGPGNNGAHPSYVITDLLTNAYYGAGFPSNSIGTIVTATETFAITSGNGSHVQVANHATFVENLSVSVNGVVISCGQAATGQYSFDANGNYSFGTDAAGHNATITYVYRDTLTQFEAFVTASGLGISPVYDTQQPVQQMIDDIAKYCFSEVVWSSGVLTLVPRGTKSMTANGVTYTAPSEVLFALTDEDFIQQSDSDPVVMTRTRVSDQDNVIQLEYLDRNNKYSPSIAEVSDQASIDRFRRRFSGSQEAHLFCDATSANIAAQYLMQRQFVRNTYAFTVDERYCVLDPMDLVSLTDSNLGLENRTVRITSISEQSDGTLQIVAEEYPIELGSAAEYDINVGFGYDVDLNVDVGNINKPIIFEAPVEIADTGIEIWASVSSNNSLFGGAEVWISSDGTTYKKAASHFGRSRQGTLSAVLPLGSDPDETNPIYVDLSMSAGQLQSGTQKDADLGNTLCWVDGEYLSYETAILNDANQYTLEGYIRRGQFGSTISAHSFGSDFVRLDDSIIKFTYNANLIGTTIYLKFTSFNVWGGGTQSLADVDAFTHLVVGPPKPGNVQGFIVSQQDGLPVVFEWKDLPDKALKGYDILYGAIGGSVDTATMLTEATRSTEMTNASVPPGTWIFYIRGHDVVDQLGPATSFQFKVVNVSGSILEDISAPDWFDALDASASGGGLFSRAILTDGNSYTVPNTVSKILVGCIGAGGTGGVGTDGLMGGGGGGGAYAEQSVTVTPGSKITYQVGKNGGATWFNSTSTVYAAGGTSANGITGGSGGLATSSIGTTVFAGGNGATAASPSSSVSYSQGGGGGGSGGPDGAGGNAPTFGSQSTQPNLLTTPNDFGDGDWELINVTCPGGVGPVVATFAGSNSYLTTKTQFTPLSNTTYIITALIETAGGTVNPNLLTQSAGYSNATFWEEINCSGDASITFNGGGQSFLTTAPQFKPASNTQYTVSAHVANATTNLRFCGNDGNGNYIAGGPSAEITVPSGGGIISWTVTTGTIGTVTNANFGLTGDANDDACTFTLSDFKVETGASVTRGTSGNKNFRFTGNDGNGGLITPSQEFTPSSNGTSTTYTFTTGTIGSSTTPNFSMTTDTANDAAAYKISNFSVQKATQSVTAFGGTGAGGVANGGKGGTGGSAINPNLLVRGNRFDDGAWELAGCTVVAGDGPVILTINAGSSILSTKPSLNPMSNTTYTISGEFSGSTSFRFFSDDGTGIRTYSQDITPDGTRKSYTLTTGTMTGNSKLGITNNTASTAASLQIGYFKVESGTTTTSAVDPWSADWSSDFGEPNNSSTVGGGGSMTWNSNPGNSGTEFGSAGTGGGGGAGGSPADGGNYGGGGGGIAETGSVPFNPSVYGGNLLTASNLLNDPAWKTFSNTSVDANNIVTFT